MKRKKFILTYLLWLLAWLPQSQENCIRPQQKTELQGENDNLNIFELVAKLRRELNAEKRRIVRSASLKNFLGSNLFDGIRKKCFTIEEISLLSARAEFESMMPIELTPTLLNERQIKTILRYFCYGHFLINKAKQNDGTNIIRKAFYDTLGGFLHFYMIPVVKASYYAGYVKVDTVFKVMAHYHKCRRLLNTNGNGWREPEVPPTKHVENGHVKPLELRSMVLQLDDEPKYCEQLDLHSGQDDSNIIDDMMLVSLPKIEIEDTDGYMGNIYLPYERKRTFNLRSPNSATVLIDFYKTVMGCYGEKCMNPKIFKSKLRDWIAESVQPHLNDEIFYPGLGSVLSLYETLKHITKKKKKCKKPEFGFNGDRMIRGCREDIAEAQHKHRCKTMKFINLENKATQCQSTMDDECDKDWLKDPLVSGVPKPKPKCGGQKAAEKASAWFGMFGKDDAELSKKEGDEESDEEKKKASGRGKAGSREGSKGQKDKSAKSKSAAKDKDRDSDADAARDRDEAEKNVKDSAGKENGLWGYLSKLNMSRFYKKGAWGFVFPRLKGLSLFSKLWEIFKFILFVIAALFVLWLLFNCCSVCLLVKAGPFKFIEYIGRALYEFGRLFMKVLAAMCRCTMALPCWRLCGGKESKPLNDPVPIEKVVIIPTESEIHKSIKEAESPKTSAVEPIRKSKVKERAKRHKRHKKTELLALPPPESEPTVEESTKKSKEKDKPKRDRKTKSQEPPANETAAEETKENDDSKKEKHDKKQKDQEKKPVEEAKEQTDDETCEDSEDEGTKTSKKSKGFFKSRKSKCEQEQNKKADKKPKEDKPRMSRLSRLQRKVKRRRGRQKTGSDNESQDSSERLLGGSEVCYSSDDHTDCSTDSTNKESNDGKSSWKTFYDF